MGMGLLRALGGRLHVIFGDRACICEIASHRTHVHSNEEVQIIFVIPDMMQPLPYIVYSSPLSIPTQCLVPSIMHIMHIPLPYFLTAQPAKSQATVPQHLHLHMHSSSLPPHPCPPPYQPTPLNLTPNNRPNSLVVYVPPSHIILSSLWKVS